MRRTIRAVSLFLPAAGLLAACVVDVGEVAVKVSCAGEGCGERSGWLHATVEDCDEDRAQYGDAIIKVASLDSGRTYSFHFDNVLDGTRCVQVFLDADTSGSLTVGDVLASEAILQGVGEPGDDADDDLDDDPEIEVRVPKNGAATVDFALDTVVAPGDPFVED